MVNPKNKSQSLVVLDDIHERIHELRGQRVMFDADLAVIYGVTTSRLNEQVKRNRKRFPEDFIFQLTTAEFRNLSQIATGFKHRDPKNRPFAFTEHGAVMLATILNTPIAIQASINIVRAFSKMRLVLAMHKGLAERVKRIEAAIRQHDQNFDVVEELLREIMRDPKYLKREIGFIEAKKGKKK
jgi:hypothetical protein